MDYNPAVMERILRIALISVLFFTIALISLHRIDNYDIWLHLRSGHYILEHRTFLRHDVFSYTVTGKPWLNHQWLAQVTFYLLQQISGFPGLILAKTLLLLAAIRLLLSINPRRGIGLLDAVLCMVAVLTASSRFLVRPELFTIFLMAVFLKVLSTYRNRRANRLIYMLPVLQFFWANLHGGSIIGLGLIWAFVLEELWRLRGRPNDTSPALRLFVCALAATAAACLNPYGVAILLRPFRQLGSASFMRDIGEWSSPFRAGPLGGGIDFALYRAIIVLSVAGFVLNFRRILLADLLVYAAFLYLSAVSRRNVALFALLSFPMTVRNIRDIGDRVNRTKLLIGRHALVPARWLARHAVALRKATRIAAVVAIFAMLILSYLLVTDRYYVRDNSSRRFGLGVTWHTYPAAASDFIEKHFPGRFFNNYDIGSFLIWRFFPRRRDFVDGRNVLFGEAFLDGTYKRVLADPDTWDALVDAYGIDLAVIRHTAFDVKGLLKKLLKDEAWPAVFFDDATIVFARRGIGLDEAIDQFRIDFSAYRDERRNSLAGRPAGKAGIFRRVSFPFGHLHRAGFFMLAGLYENAVYEYSLAVERCGDNPYIHNHLGIALSRLGDRAAAAHAFRRAISLRPAYSAAWNNLGLTRLETGDPAGALEYFLKAVEVDNRFVEAYNNAGISYSRMGRPSLARSMWERALQIDPYCGPARENLGRQVPGRREENELQHR